MSDEAVAEWERTAGGRSTGSPGSPGWRRARASVLADAVTWATSLWSAFDWGACPRRAPVVGGAEDQWSCPAARVGARSRAARAELRGRGWTRGRRPAVTLGSGRHSCRSLSARLSGGAGPAELGLPGSGAAALAPRAGAVRRVSACGRTPGCQSVDIDGARSWRPPTWWSTRWRLGADAPGRPRLPSARLGHSRVRAVVASSVNRGARWPPASGFPAAVRGISSTTTI